MSSPVRDRTLAWDGCRNVRDLGGHTTEDGRETAWGHVVRADALRSLSEDGWRALGDYGIRTVVDLRFPEEREADPPRDVPIEAVHISLLGELGSEHWPEIEAVSAAAPDDATATRDVYLEFLERFRDNFARAIRAIADAPAGGVLVHCQGGKDRTGLIAALLLRLVGVPKDEIARDYALSEENLRVWSEEWFADAADDDERRRRRRIAVSPEASMRGVLDELERRHGGVAEYLRDGGIAEDELERVRARLVD